MVPCADKTTRRNFNDRFTAPPDRRSIIAEARRCSARLSCPARRRCRRGPCARGRSARQVRAFLSGLEPDKRKAASFAWNGSEWRGWNYFGATGYIKPGLRLEQMSAAQKEPPGTCSARVVAAGRREGTERDAAAGHPGGERQRRRSALVGALLARGVRHAGRDRRVGLPLRGPSSHSVGRRARQSHRFGHAVVVLGESRIASSRDRIPA